MSLSELSSKVALMLQGNGFTLATAESCSGGLLASTVTDIPGSSNYYVGGVVSYSNELKMSFLAVSEETLRLKGAVSAETVEQMASGVQRLTGATYALATSGIAGPGGGSPEKPVGLVYIGLAGPTGVISRRMQFTGERGGIKTQTVEAALELLVESI